MVNIWYVYIFIYICFSGDMIDMIARGKCVIPSRYISIICMSPVSTSVLGREMAGATQWYPNGDLSGGNNVLVTHGVSSDKDMGIKP